MVGCGHSNAATGPGAANVQVPLTLGVQVNARGLRRLRGAAAVWRAGQQLLDQAGQPGLHLGPEALQARALAQLAQRDRVLIGHAADGSGVFGGLLHP